MINVVVAEDSYVYRKGLVTALSEVKTVKQVYEVSEREMLFAVLLKRKIDVLFLGICIPRDKAVAIVKKVLRICPDIRIIAVSLYCENDMVHDILKAGAYGYILKNIEKSDVERAIADVMENRYFFSKEVIAVLTKTVMNGGEKQEKKFNEKEKKILELLCKGYSTNFISSELNLNKRTCEGYRARMILKAKAENTIGLVVFAIKNGIVQV